MKKFKLGVLIFLMNALNAFNCMAQGTPAATPAGQAAQPSFGSMLMPFAIIMVIFYFLMIRPQKKKMDQEQKFLNSLKKGDEVYTRGGLLGTIQGLTDTVVILDVGEGMKLKVLRSQVAGESKSVVQKNVQEQSLKK